VLSLIVVVAVVAVGAAPICASTAVKGVATTAIRANMSIVIIATVFVDFLIVIFCHHCSMRTMI
jgi:hypothetical protein